MVLCPIQFILSYIMGNTACCEEVRENVGVIQQQDQKIHKMAHSTSEIREEIKEEPQSNHFEHPAEKQENQEPAWPVHESKSQHEEKPQENKLHDHEHEIVISPEVKALLEPEPIELPHLSEKVNVVLHTHSFFEAQQHTLENHRKKFNEDIYVGVLDETAQRPNGFGKMYKDDGSLYIGHFQNGKAQGSGVFIFSNGSYYNGDFRDNKADSEHATFKSESVTYEGGFKSNAYHGLGKEIGSNYEFNGEFNKGRRVRGILKWEASDGAYEYEGSFNSENKFHATGILREPHGVYEGEFVDGLKHGHGYFRSVSGYRYKGDYTNDVRTGKGQIFNQKNELIYEGEVQNGLPNGKGKGLRDGKMVESVWDQGIDVQLIS